MCGITNASLRQSQKRKRVVHGQKFEEKLDSQEWKSSK